MLSNWKIKSRLFFFAIFCFLFLPSTQILFAAQLSNPLGTTDIKIVMARIIRYLLGISGGVALLMFVWGGFQYLMAGANPDYAKKGKDTLKYAVIGLVIIMTSYLLVGELIKAFVVGGNLSSGGQTSSGCPPGQQATGTDEDGKYICQ